MYLVFGVTPRRREDKVPVYWKVLKASDLEMGRLRQDAPLLSVPQLLCVLFF